MPDSDGYEILWSLSGARARVLHHPCDAYVDNTRDGRATHLRVCPARELEKKRERQRQREARGRLRVINRERALERKVLSSDLLTLSVSERR